MTFILPIALAMALIFAVYQAARLVMAASRASRGRTHAGEDERVVRLRDERERCLASIKELETDFEMGKLSKEDHEELRGFYEQRAVEVIRALREVERSAPSLVLGLLAALALTLAPSGDARAQAMPPGHPPIDGMGSMGAAAPANTDTTVRVIHTDGTGATGPGAGVRVVIEALEAQRPSMMGPQEEAILAVWSGVTGPDGVARFGRLQAPDRSTLRVQAFDGTTRYLAAQGGAGQWDVRTYETTTELDALSMDARLDLSVEEGALTVRVTLTFVNASPLAVDLSKREAPVFLPVLAPVAMGGVIPRGFMPPQASKHMSTNVSPDLGRLATIEGGYAFRGLVLPGETTTVRFGYPLDYAADDMQVGLQAGDVPLRSVMATVSSATRLFPTVRVSVPTVGAVTTEGGDRMVMVKSLDAVPAHGEVVLALAGLPVHGRIGRRYASAVLIVGGVILAVGFLRARALARPEAAA